VTHCIGPEGGGFLWQIGAVPKHGGKRFGRTDSELMDSKKRRSSQGQGLIECLAEALLHVFGRCGGIIVGVRRTSCPNQ